MSTEQEKNKKIVSIVSVCIFIALTVLITCTVGRKIVDLAGDPQGFRSWVAERGLLGKLAYIGMVFLQIVVAIIPGEPFELGAGYAFGAWQGLLLAEIGILLGSAFVFLFVKKLGTKAVYAFVPEEKLRSFRFLQDSEKRNAIVFLLFFIPGTPKDVLTYFAGLTPMKLWEWLLITCVARIPSVVSSTLAGAAAGKADYKSAIIIYAVTAVISAAGALFYRRFTKRHDNEENKA